MIDSRKPAPNAGSPPHDATIHRFKVGQIVRLKPSFRREIPATDIFRITATLPPVGSSLQYRIRSDDERHERVTTQDDLEPVRATAPGDSLARRTFENG